MKIGTHRRWILPHSRRSPSVRTPLCRKVLAKLIVFPPIFPKMAGLADSGWFLKLAGAKSQKFKQAGIFLHNDVYPSSVVLVVASLPSYISALSGEQTEQARPRMACPCFIVFVQMHRKKCRHSENSSKGLLMKSPVHKDSLRPAPHARWTGISTQKRGKVWKPRRRIFSRISLKQHMEYFHLRC